MEGQGDERRRRQFKMVSERGTSGGAAARSASARLADAEAAAQTSRVGADDRQALRRLRRSRGHRPGRGTARARLFDRLTRGSPTGARARHGAAGMGQRRFRHRARVGALDLRWRAGAAPAAYARLRRRRQWRACAGRAGARRGAEHWRRNGGALRAGGGRAGHPRRARGDRTADARTPTSFHELAKPRARPLPARLCRRAVVWTVLGVDGAPSRRWERGRRARTGAGRRGARTLLIARRALLGRRDHRTDAHGTDEPSVPGRRRSGLDSEAFGPPGGPQRCTLHVRKGAGRRARSRSR